MPPSLTYAVADLHGSDDLLRLALDRIEAHSRGSQEQGNEGRRRVVFLGDYVDRGPGSRQILDRLMQGPPQGWDWICLKGNHEDMMAEAIKGRGDPDDWLMNGGEATLRSFATGGGRMIEPYEIPAPYLAFIAALPLIHVERYRIFVHAGVDPALPLDAQTTHDLLWRRDQGPDGYAGLHVVHGHTPDRKGPNLFAGRTNLDTLAWSTGRLVVGVFDDDRPGGPVELIEVQR